MADLPKETPKIVNFDYIKGNNFRVAHVDGAYMTSSTAGLAISFFTERHPIPRRVVHNIVEGSLGPKFPSSALSGMLLSRDVEMFYDDGQSRQDYSSNFQGKLLSK